MKIVNWKCHVGFVADKTTYQPHVEEAQISDSLNNLFNTSTSYTTNLT